MKSISKPQHQIVGVFKLAQLIPYMQKQMACNVSLESQNLVEPFHITTAVYQIPTDTDIDRKKQASPVLPEEITPWQIAYGKEDDETSNRLSKTRPLYTP